MDAHRDYTCTVCINNDIRHELFAGLSAEELIELLNKLASWRNRFGEAGEDEVADEISAIEVDVCDAHWVLSP